MSMLANPLGQLGIALDDLGRDVPEALREDETVLSALNLLGLLRAFRKDLQAIEGYVESVAAQRMDSSVFDAPGVHAIRRQTAEREEWDHEGLASAVLVTAMVNQETGELPSEEAQAVASRVKAALVECGTFSRWRIKKLAEIGIGVSDFRKRTPGRWTVEVMLGDDVEQVAS